MINVTKIAPAGDLYNDRTLNLIRRTVANDCNDDEFSLFIKNAQHMNLDPMRRQIFAFVFGKNDPAKRRMSIVVSIDGLRSIADRTGCYRPDEDEASFEIDTTLKGPLNPYGLVKATVRVYKYSHGEWHKVTGTAYWDEVAPLKDEWGYDEASGRRKPTGKKTLDDSGQWARMPRLMLAKCAEAQALRRAWPEDFANVYEASELDRAKAIDVLPSEAAENGALLDRQEKIGRSKDSIPFTFGEDGAIEMVPVGQVADRCIAFLEENSDEPSTILLWQERNRVGLREFWAKSPNDSLELKKQIETVTAK